MGGGTRKPGDGENEGRKPPEREIKPRVEAELDAADRILDETDKVEKKGVEAGTGTAADRPGEAQVKPGMEVQLDGQKWKIDQLTPEKGLVVLKQPGRGFSEAVISERASAEELAKNFVSVETNGVKLYARKGDKKGEVFEAIPMKDGEVNLIARKDVRFVSSQEIKGVLEAQERVERVARMTAAARYKKGMGIEYDNESWKVAEVLGDKGRVLLHNPEYGQDFAKVSTSVTPKELEEKYTKVQVGDKELFIAKNGAVMEKAPFTARDGKVQLWPNHQFAAPQITELDALARAARTGTANALGRVEAAPAEARPAEKAVAGQETGGKEIAGQIKAGDFFEIDGEKRVVAEIDNESKYALVQEKSDTRPARVLNPSEADLARDFKQMKVGNNVYYFNESSGDVYQPTGNGREMKEVKNRSVWSVEQIKVAQSPEAREALNPPPLEKPQGERVINGHVVKVTTDGPMRTVNIDGVEVKLAGNGWYQTDLKDADGRYISHGDVKLHVFGKDPKDLAKVQAELIPELVRATQPGGPLYGKIGSFKTHDPMYMVQDGWEDRAVGNADRMDKFMPGPTGQNAKGFTIYPRDAEAAKEVRDHISKFLTERGLRMTEPVNSGNVADSTIDRQASNRVSLERDVVEKGYFKDVREGALLAEEQNKAAREYAERKVAEGAKGWEAFKSPADLYADQKSGILKDSVLNLLSDDFKLDPKACELVYADPILGEAERRLMLVTADKSYGYKGGFYLDESKCKKEKDIAYDFEGRLKSGLTGRSAYYEIAKVLSASSGKDLDPANLRVQAITSQNAHLPPEHAAARHAFKYALNNAEAIVGQQLHGENGVYKLEKPLQLSFDGKPMKVGAIEVLDGQVYLKSAEDGSKYRAKPWLDAIGDSLRERADSRDYGRFAAQKALDKFDVSIEARVALVQSLAREYAYNMHVSSPSVADAAAARATAGVKLQKGGAPAMGTAGGIVPSGGGVDIARVGDGYKVEEKGRERGVGAVRRYEEIAREDLAKMRERIMDDKSGKLTPEDKAASLRVLELAQEGDLRAREAIGKALFEAKARGGFDKATGTLVGVGIVASSLAGWYAYHKFQQARDVEVPKASVR